MYSRSGIKRTSCSWIQRSGPLWPANDDLRNLLSLDILLAFEDYSRVHEQEFEDQM